MLKFGVNIKIKTSKGVNALQIATQANSVKLVVIMILFSIILNKRVASLEKKITMAIMYYIGLAIMAIKI